MEPGAYVRAVPNFRGRFRAFTDAAVRPLLSHSPVVEARRPPCPRPGGPPAGATRRCERQARASGRIPPDDARWLLAGLGAAGRLAAITRIVATAFADALGTDRDALSLDRPLASLRVDPTTLAEIQHGVNATLGTDLPLTDLLATASIRTIATDLDRLVRDRLSAGPP
jgi:hypothetical protein